MNKEDGKCEYTTKDMIAKLFGLSGRRIEQLVSDGVIERVKIKGGGVRFEVVPTIQKYIKYLSEKAYNKEQSKTEIELKEHKLRAEVALKESQGELHRIKTEIAAGNYISVEEIKADYSRFFIVFKNFALSIPGKVAGQLTGYVEPVEVRKIENDLQSEVKKLLKNFISRAIVEETEPKEMQSKQRGRPRKSVRT